MEHNYKKNVTRRMLNGICCNIEVFRWEKIGKDNTPPLRTTKCSVCSGNINLIVTEY